MRQWTSCGIVNKLLTLQSITPFLLMTTIMAMVEGHFLLWFAESLTSLLLKLQGCLFCLLRLILKNSFHECAYPLFHFTVSIRNAIFACTPILVLWLSRQRINEHAFTFNGAFFFFSFLFGQMSVWSFPKISGKTSTGCDTICSRHNGRQICKLDCSNINIHLLLSEQLIWILSVPVCKCDTALHWYVFLSLV